MNKIVKLFTMIKNEDDIVEDWLNYHGSLFGFTNLYVIDNFSTDNTYKILKIYENEKGINLSREEDYRKKGVYMTNLINSCDNYDIAYPLDIDEFIVHYDKKTNKLDPFKVVPYLNSLSYDNSVFKANYVNFLLDKHSKKGFEKAAREGKYGIYSDYGDIAKTFFHKKLWKGIIDHGNHFPKKNYLMTDLVLVHFHCRNYKQQYDKIVNNVKGLGYDPNNKEELIKFKEKGCSGFHHVIRMIEIIEDKFDISTDFEYNGQKDIILLDPLTEYVKKL